MEVETGIAQSGETTVKLIENADGSVTEVRETVYIEEESVGLGRYGGEELGEGVHLFESQETQPDGTILQTTTTVTVENGSTTEEVVTETLEVIDTDSPTTEENHVHVKPQINGNHTNNNEEDLELGTKGRANGSLGERRPRITYEAISQEYDEYVPPKQYQKQEDTSAASTLAPKVSIMADNENEESVPAIEGEGLPKDYTKTTGAGSSKRQDSLDEPKATSAANQANNEGEVREVDAVSYSQSAVSNGASAEPNSAARAFSVSSSLTDDPSRSVREGSIDELELPPQGHSSSLVAKFKQMESPALQPLSPTTSLPTASMDKPRTGAYGYSAALSPDSSEAQMEDMGAVAEPQFEGGEFENDPEQREDVVRESAGAMQTEELPEQGLARGLLSKFKNMEKESKGMKSYKPSGIGNKATPTPIGPRASDFSGGAAEIVSEQTPHREEDYEGGEYENEPAERREDVLREERGPDGSEMLRTELPQTGTTRSVADKFRMKMEDSSRTKEHRPSGIGMKATPTSARVTHPQQNGTPIVEPQFEGGEFENEPEQREDVVRESVGAMQTEELPEQGLARGLLSKFKNMEKESKGMKSYKPSGIGNKATPTPIHRGPRTSTRSSVTSDGGDSVDTGPVAEPQFEGGEFENDPEQREDVVRESAGAMQTEELPEQGLAKGLLSKFKNMEKESKEVKKREHKPSGVGLKSTPSRMHVLAGRTSVGEQVDGPTTPSIAEEGPAEERAVEGGEYENEPEVRTDVIRESSDVRAEELPERGLAKNLMNRFKNMEQERPNEVEHIPSGIGSKPTPTPLARTPSSVGAGSNRSTVSRGSSVLREGDAAQTNELIINETSTDDVTVDVTTDVTVDITVESKEEVAELEIKEAASAEVASPTVVESPSTMVDSAEAVGEEIVTDTTSNAADEMNAMTEEVSVSAVEDVAAVSNVDDKNNAAPDESADLEKVNDSPTPAAAEAATEACIAVEEATTNADVEKATADSTCEVANKDVATTESSVKETATEGDSTEAVEDSTAAIEAARTDDTATEAAAGTEAATTEASVEDSTATTEAAKTEDTATEAAAIETAATEAAKTEDTATEAATTEAAATEAAKTEDTATDSAPAEAAAGTEAATTEAATTEAATTEAATTEAAVEAATEAATPEESATEDSANAEVAATEVAATIEASIEDANVATEAGTTEAATKDAAIEDNASAEAVVDDSTNTEVTAEKAAAAEEAVGDTAVKETAVAETAVKDVDVATITAVTEDAVAEDTITEDAVSEAAAEDTSVTDVAKEAAVDDSAAGATIPESVSTDEEPTILVVEAAAPSAVVTDVAVTVEEVVCLSSAPISETAPPSVNVSADITLNSDERGDLSGLANDRSSEELGEDPKQETGPSVDEGGTIEQNS